jgi:hypothetical protein
VPELCLFLKSYSTLLVGLDETSDDRKPYPKFALTVPQFVPQIRICLGGVSEDFSHSHKVAQSIDITMRTSKTLQFYRTFWGF